MARNVNAEGLKLIKQWEGYRDKAYKDSVGVWTIGYGHTSAAGAPVVTQGMKITEAQASEILRRDIDTVEAAVVRNVKVPLTDNQFAALVSFVYNVGEGAFQKSTLLKKLNAKDYNSVPKELMKWVNGKGKKIPGLVNRRAAEAGLWAKGGFVSSNYVEAEPEPKPIVTKENIAIGTSVITSLGLSQVTGPLAWGLAAVLVISVGFGLFMYYKKHKED